MTRTRQEVLDGLVEKVNKARAALYDRNDRVAVDDPAARYQLSQALHGLDVFTRACQTAQGATS